MTSKATEEAKDILKEALNELESNKGSVLTGIQKLSRASDILNENDIFIWCEIQLGNPKFTEPLKKMISTLFAMQTEKEERGEHSKETLEDFNNSVKKLKKLNLKREMHFTDEELNVKSYESTGGYSNIGFVEERYNDLVRTKKGNDGTYYKFSLQENLTYVRKKAHEKANKLYKQIAFSDIPQTAFDVLKNEIDDKLLDIDPELAERLMLAFKRVNTNKPEEWSQALTTCRRLIEELANNLYPPTDKKINGRSLGKSQYINRIWVFMDESIESNSDRELAKTHVDFIGNYLKLTLNKTQKGVHSSLTKYESIKAVLHTYLLIGDILGYLEKSPVKDKLNINSASLDELESMLGIKRSIAKNIIKLRVEQGPLDEKKLESIKGIGPKTISKAKKSFSFTIKKT
ncbi:ComEA family DNA-binding protein [Methanobacterium petrolearium]|uniref:ComEA family DNA-binding protein n=1 Tax=Methanobacterium petrolearium TaxID=710190 RepID=UPI001AE11BED|nr:helix-hairpin-helix domain-containing protein [Methanobacterium petrolearium]MBP1945198.1 hypothetical protein [Methanobacterium petrolearium]BDZ71129.1 hypothetical protein GCM10025861_16460 [Methanobacterium petrolearium]